MARRHRLGPLLHSRLVATPVQTRLPTRAPTRCRGVPKPFADAIAAISTSTPRVRGATRRSLTHSTHHARDEIRGVSARGLHWLSLLPQRDCGPCAIWTCWCPEDQVAEASHAAADFDPASPGASRRTAGYFCGSMLSFIAGWQSSPGATNSGFRFRYLEPV